VVEASVLERSLPNDSRLRNIRRMLRRFNSKEVPDAIVAASFGKERVAGQTDDEGYFDLQVTPALAEASELPGAAGDFYPANLEVTDVPLRGFVPVRSSADILIPGPRVERGIISDIDDTVLQTHVTQKLKMIWVTVSGSAYTRMPFEGTSELYRALVDGVSGNAQNPVFYVSKSPWNLYDFLPFVLIGDSGERDPDIYLATAAAYPGRILAIYIRDLGGKHGSAGRAAEACARARQLGTEMLWVEHANQALEHARKHGLARATE
jgi:phosphatidate phosphatase APP1